MKLLILFALSASLSFGTEGVDSADWWNSITEMHRCTAKAEEGNAVLEVELLIPDESQVREVKDAGGEVTGYALEGKPLPHRFWPGCSLIQRFELEWEGKKIAVHERFWSDLAGFRIQESALDPAKFPAEQRFEVEQFLDGLEKPRVILSADGGTLLIEWVRPEECDSRSTIRWIITRDGTVLRHRHTPPHDC